MAAISEQYEEQNTVDFPEMWITNLYTDSSFPLWSIPETKGWHAMAAWSFPISFHLATGTETQQYLFLLSHK